MNAGLPLDNFWSYYGGKTRAAARYPRPRHRTIVEPFAGAAGYSLRYPDRNVVLVEKYAVIAEMWRYLIAVPASEVRRIPTVDRVDDLPAWVPLGARYLVGFLMNHGTTTPRRQLSSGQCKLRASGRTFGGWTEARRARVAQQVGHIRHWRILEGSYEQAPDVEATWFVDPPYQTAGSYYVHTLTHADYASLATWCRTRRGQVMVCEAQGADWLPFRPFATLQSGPCNDVSREAIWTAP